MEYTKRELNAIDMALNIIREKTANTNSTFNDVNTTKKYMALELSKLDPKREHFVVLFMTAKNRMIACEVLFSGTVDAAAVYPRIIVQRALELNAVSLILAHNHPSGVAEPSTADIRITGKIVDACRLLDMRVLDHIVVGDCLAVSMADRGML